MLLVGIGQVLVLVGISFLKLKLEKLDEKMNSNLEKQEKFNFLASNEEWSI